MNAPVVQQRSWVGLLIPAILLFAALVALGTWQLERKAWKESLITALTERLAAAPAALPPQAAWPNLRQADDEYRRVELGGVFENGKEALVYAPGSAFRPDVSGVGYWVFTPMRLAGGGVVVVNRGFVPPDRKDPASRADGQITGPLAIVGTMRWPDRRNWFSPRDDAANNLWFARDPVAIADAKGVGAVAPFYVEQESPTPPGGWPQPGKLVVNLRDAHLQYAITWYGLALALVVLFALWAIKTGRRPADEKNRQSR